MALRDSVRHRPTTDALPIIAVTTYAIAILAWFSLINHWLPQPSRPMDTPTPMSNPGAPEAMALANGPTGIAFYLLTWAVMMIAMMYPTTVPLFRLYYKTLDGTTTTGKATRIAAFMGIYALIWTLTGFIPLLLNAVIPLTTLTNTQTTLLTGGMLILLAAYQLSPYKDQCLTHCRSPLSFLMTHHRPGISGAIKTSWAFSVFCVGCCWALFAFMVVVGSMNILWMAVIAIVLSLERILTWGDRVAKAAGIVAGIAGAAVILTAFL